jgi:hypothetical protein
MKMHRPGNIKLHEKSTVHKEDKIKLVHNYYDVFVVAVLVVVVILVVIVQIRGGGSSLTLILLMWRIG